jgi:hypothetical protein
VGFQHNPSELPAGVIRITVPGWNGTVHTGVQVSPELVLTAKSIFPAGTTASSIVLESRFGSGLAVSQPAVEVVPHPWYDAALVVLAVPFKYGGLGTGIHPLDPKPLSGNGATFALSCWAFSGRTGIFEVKLFVDQPTSPTFPLNNGQSSDALDNSTTGAPCFDLDSAVNDPPLNLTGVSLTPTTALHANVLGPWIEAQKSLTLLRQLGARAVSLQTDVTVYDQALHRFQVRHKCLDIPETGDATTYADQAPINQWDCHYQTNQRFYLDYTGDASAPTVVSALTGKCVDVPGFNAVAGASLQQYTCNAGTNQRWAFPQTIGGTQVVQQSSQKCLGLSADPLFGNGSAVRQVDCAGAPRWVLH